ncbi:zinc-binding alcohol dehydrogenase [Marmoricola endophyticus]|uniref:Zinc-binding alcohol dehydrogenase n=1 Tax=Marmoricola endophyticus TaxID=2040280 RepID=A0A917BL30_9ACTN|nr:NADP-dependent oxidoreductase [Marmoricola endophyticus]GGF50289.1 zinc-binding alcohol dehydrogenase [Marmoricola endophyticus]
MRAVGATEYGGPDVLRVIDVDEERVSPGLLRIRVRAAAVSPTDTLKRAGADVDEGARPDPAVVPGMDLAGVLLEIGPDTPTELSVGDDVVAIVVPDGGTHGAYREEIVLPRGSVVAAPQGASYAEASTLPMNGLTARRALDQLGLEPGQTIAVTGAAGAFGGYVVQLAKADGLTVVADASEADEELVEGLGADHVVRRGAGFADAVRDLVPDGVDGLADGALLGADALPAVAEGGAVATIRGWDGSDSERDDLRFEPVLVRDAAEDHDALDRLRVQAEMGVVTLRVADVVGADDAAEAHRRLEAGGVRGRMVISFER